jgi:hypothetical protein
MARDQGRLRVEAAVTLAAPEAGDVIAMVILLCLLWAMWAMR